MTDRPLRILHAPNNIANQAWSIATGLRALGHEAEVWHFGPNPFDFPADRRVAFPPADEQALVAIVLEAAARFDIFHFHFARSLVPYQVGYLPGLWDLPLLRALGKPVFFTFHGTDIRERSAHIEEDRWSFFRFSDMTPDEDDIAKRLEIIRTYANRTYVCSPPNTRWVPDAGFHPRALILDDWRYVGPVRREAPLVVHAPSRRATKGTSFVLEAVAAAERAGARFEFRLVEGVPAAELREVLADCDILIDNVLLGDYEVTSLEAMAMGKTVITRITDPVRKMMGESPLLDADPDSLADVLQRAVAGAELRAGIAPRARQFVEMHHTPERVAKILLTDYLDPPDTIPLSFPSWAALAGLRAEERLQQQVLQLQTALRRKGKFVTLGSGRFSRMGAALDRRAARIRRRLSR